MNIHQIINLKHSLVLRGAREGMHFYYLLSYYNIEEKCSPLNRKMKHSIKLSKKYKFEKL